MKEDENAPPYEGEIIYKGKFILEVTILKGHNDDEESIQKIKNIIKEISPSRIITARIEDEILKKKLYIKKIPTVVPQKISKRQKCKKLGIVRSIPGVNGGYELARISGNITF